MKVVSFMFLSLIPLLVNKEPILPKNGAGRIGFEEVIPADNLGKDVLYGNAMKYVSSIEKVGKGKKDIHVDYHQGVVSNKAGFYVYTNGLLTPQIHGEITYNIRIEILENSYKYTITDFVFQYYQRNRYGRYAPVSGKTKALEEERFAGMQNIWHGHKKTTKEVIEGEIQTLKERMTESPQAAVGGKKG
jgi:hypothetical protein